jgi:hypothetical protein
LPVESRKNFYHDLIGELSMLKTNKSKSILLSACFGLMGASSVLAAPTSPMEGFEPTNISERKMQQIWRTMENSFKGKDCYRRAHIWAHDMYTQDRIKSRKLFLHYTNKWNRELDTMGGEFSGWFRKVKQKTFDPSGISKRTRNMVRTNITWDYHVAPLVLVEGRDMILDKELTIAYDANPADYSENEGWNLKKRPATPEEWVEGLTIRGEILWKGRKALLRKQLRKANKKKKYAEARNIEAKMVSLGMDSPRIDIKCEQVDSIADVDKNHTTAWCFTTEAPMYYYNEIDLRNLAYGRSRYNYASPPPLSLHNENSYRNGRAYRQNRFNPAEIKDAQGERKF